MSLSAAPAAWKQQECGPSALELLHPDGVAHTKLLLGSSDFSWLTPNADAHCPADMVVLSPSPAECRKDGWLDAAVLEAVRRLAPDGLIYVMAAPRWRPRIRMLLMERGLTCGSPLAHLPDWFHSTYLAPPTPAVLQHVLSHSDHRWLRRLFRPALASARACRAAAAMLPCAGFTARRPDARPLFEWLSRVDPSANDRTPLIYTSRRGRGMPVLFRFARGRLASVAKVAGAGRREGEASRLASLGADARLAGASVPRLLREGAFGPGGVWIQSPVAGSPVAVALSSGPRRLPILLSRIAGWLGEWNTRTRRTHVLAQERLQRELLTRAAILQPVRGCLGDYQRRLMRACGAAAGTVPLVAAHHDLTMWNVLAASGEDIGVVDWEDAEPESLPLTDLLYAMVDAVAASVRYASRRQAFRDCFCPDGAHAPMVRKLLTEAADRLSLSHQVVRLCFHACWLRHAVNELQAERAEGEFVQIWSDLAAGVPGFEEWAL